jgi:hypothetical protein
MNETPHRCAMHPCRAFCDEGHSTCAKHRAAERELHARYNEFRDRLAAEDQIAREEAAARSARVDQLIAKRRAARGETGP